MFRASAIFTNYFSPLNAALGFMESGFVKTFKYAILCLLLAGCQSSIEQYDSHGNPNFNALYESAQSNRQAQSDLVELVLKEPSLVNSFTYFIAAKYAISLGKIEDAGFLFFAGQARGKLELYMHPAPSVDVGSALGALKQTIGSVVNPAIMQPVIYSNIVKRLNSWEVIPDPSYEFPWDTTNNNKTATEVGEKSVEIKSSMFAYMKPMAELLDIPDYYQAFQTIQDYNLKLSYKQRSEPEFLDKLNEAKKVIVGIEKSKGYDIFKSRFDKTQP